MDFSHGWKNRRRSILKAGLAALGTQTPIQNAIALLDEKSRKLVSLEEIRSSMQLIASIHESKKAIRPGDWLEDHQESGQSFEQYLSSVGVRLCTRYGAMYIQPLGEFTEPEKELVNATVSFMERFFGMSVKLLESRSLNNLPKSAMRTHPEWKVHQVLSTYLLDNVLKPRRPKDAIAVLGLTSTDLWPGKNWNFVFGQASLTDRVGVWSFYRNGNLLGTKTEKLSFLRRTIKTAVHETGHMLGIPHCIAYECGMNGSNNLEESDRQLLEFCPECQAKVSWACGGDWEKRYEELFHFANESGLKAEGEFWKKSLVALKAS